MAATLILYLTDLNAEQVLAGVIHDDKIEQAQFYNMHEITRMAITMNLVVIVPSSEITIAVVNLPMVKPQQRIAALGYAIEEKLLTDIDKLHFAVDAFNGSGSVNVAIVEHDMMTKIKAWLKHHALSSNLILPDVLALPYQQNTWSVLVENDHCIVRTGAYDGFSIEMNNFHSLLEKKFIEIGKPDQLFCFGQDLEICKKLLKIIDGIKITYQPIQSVLTLFSKHYLDHPINLLQGQYANKQPSTKLPKNKRMLLGLACGWMVLALLTYTINIHSLNTAHAELNRQISALYYQVFPHASSVVSPQFRVQQQLTQLSGTVNKDAFDPLFTKVAEILHAYPKLTITNVAYSNNQLTLALDIADLDQFNQFLTSMANNKFSNKKIMVTNTSAEILIWMT